MKWHWLDTLPTTNARIALSILLVGATGIVTLVRWTDPPVAWLAFLGLSLGLDIAHFGIKRFTTWKPNGDPPAKGASE